MMVEDREERESNWDFTMAMLGIHEVKNFRLLSFAESSR